MNESMLLGALIISLIVTLCLVIRDACASVQIKELNEENSTLKEKIQIKRNRIDRLEMEIESLERDLENGNNQVKEAFQHLCEQVPKGWIKQDLELEVYRRERDRILRVLGK